MSSELWIVWWVEYECERFIDAPIHGSSFYAENETEANLLKDEWRTEHPMVREFAWMNYSQRMTGPLELKMGLTLWMLSYTREKKLTPTTPKQLEFHYVQNGREAVRWVREVIHELSYPIYNPMLEPVPHGFTIGRQDALEGVV